MVAPKYLPPEARKYWHRIYPHLQHRLTPTDLPAFEIMCRDWAIIQTIDPTADGKLGSLWSASKKSYLAFSKQFGLTPDSRKKVDPPKEQTLQDVLSGGYETRKDH